MVEQGKDEQDPFERAKGQARSLLIRTAEAVALRWLIVDRIQRNRKPMIGLGDFNDEVHSVAGEIISGTPPWRNLSRDQKDSIWDVLLYNAKDLQARRASRDFYFTHIFNGRYGALDHVLVSEEFVRANPEHIGDVRYTTVLNDHLIDDTLSNERIPAWQSDHGQVVATIDLKP